MNSFTHKNKEKLTRKSNVHEKVKSYLVFSYFQLFTSSQKVIDDAFSFEDLVRKVEKTIGCVDSRLFALKRTITQVMIKKKGMSAK